MNPNYEGTILSKKFLKLQKIKWKMIHFKVKHCSTANAFWDGSWRTARNYDPYCISEHIKVSNNMFRKIKKCSDDIHPANLDFHFHWFCMQLTVGFGKGFFGKSFHQPTIRNHIYANIFERVWQYGLLPMHSRNGLLAPQLGTNDF